MTAVRDIMFNQTQRSTMNYINPDISTYIEILKKNFGQQVLNQEVAKEVY